MTYLFLAILVFALAGAGLYFAPKLFPQSVTTVRWSIKAGAAAFLLLILASGSMFYAEPGFNYHVRTALGTEAVYTTTGWKFHWFGKYTEWHKAISISTTSDKTIQGESVSMLRECWNVRMLDKVDGCLSTSVRFRIPDDTDSMLKLAREYRTEDNLTNTMLVPSVNQTMNATAQLMSAEDFFNGGRSTFDVDFDQQMRTGLYQVRRLEKRQTTSSNHRISNNAAKAEAGIPQESEQEETKVVYEVEKLRDANGQLLIRPHNFLKFNVRVEDAIVTDFQPNKAFVSRLEQVQEASSAKAKAREQRMQEEETRLFVVAKGQREQAEAEAQELKRQIVETTKAETDKQLALTAASREKEKAVIDKEAAQIQLERDRLVAQSKTVLADAEAYQKRAVIQANGALEQKLSAEVAIQKSWAEAFAKRAVPTTVIGASGAPVGSNTELQQIQQMMTVEMAKRLNYNRDAKD